MARKSRLNSAATTIATLVASLLMLEGLVFAQGPVIDEPKPKVRMSGTPDVCTAKEAKEKQESLSLAFTAADTLNGCLLDTAEMTKLKEEEAGPEALEKICTTAIYGASRAVAKIEGMGILHTDTYHAIRAANEEIKKNKTTRSYETRLKHLQNASKLSAQQVERIARRGNLNLQLSGINFFRGVKFLTSLKFLAPASGISASIMGLAPTVAKSYEDALCEESGLIPTTLVEGKCTIDYRATEALADFIVTGQGVEDKLQKVPHLCDYLGRLALETYRGLTAALPYLDEYKDMQLSSDDVFCYNDTRNYSVDFKAANGDTKKLTYTKAPNSFRVVGSSNNPIFEILDVPIVDGQVSSPITVINQGKSREVDISRPPENLRDRQIANIISATEMSDRFFFGPFVTRCCNQAKKDLRSIKGCPPIGLEQSIESPAAGPSRESVK